jgi:hypothetical protein
MVMAIYRMLQNSGLEPDEIKRMTTAYEKAFLLLGLKVRTDPLTETVARHIIEVADTGEKDPDLSCALALRRIGVPPEEPAKA